MMSDSSSSTTSIFFNLCTWVNIFDTCYEQSKLTNPSEKHHLAMYVEFVCKMSFTLKLHHRAIYLTHVDSL